MFNEYPYVNLQDVNLDWILKHIKDLETNLQDFIKINTIKYADPIIWNITTQYEANTVVVDGNTGTAYLSVAPVPTGVGLTNTDYWTPIFTLNLLSANQNITFRDDGTNVVATFASDTGDWVLWNFYLYRVTQPISVNTAYVEGFNIERFSVELFIRDYISTVLTIIGDLNDLTTADKSDIVAAINELVNALNAAGDYLDRLSKQYDNVAAMCADSTLTNGDFVHTKGYYSPNDGGGAWYIISDTAGAFYETVGDLYANLIYSNVLNVKQCGLKGNFETNDSAVINKIMTFFNSQAYASNDLTGDIYYGNNLKLFFPKDNYKFNMTITTNNYDIIGNDSIIDGDLGAAFTVTGYHINIDGFSFVHCANAIIYNGANLETGWFNVTNCRFYKTTGDAIQINDLQSYIGTIERCMFFQCVHTLNVTHYADHLSLKNCWISVKPMSVNYDASILFGDVGELVVDGCLFVPAGFSTPNILCAYIKCAGNCTIVNSHFGGEAGSMPILITDVQNASLTEGTFVIRDCPQTYCQNNGRALILIKSHFHKIEVDNCIGFADVQKPVRIVPGFGPGSYTYGNIVLSNLRGNTYPPFSSAYGYYYQKGVKYLESDLYPYLVCDDYMTKQALNLKVENGTTITGYYNEVYNSGGFISRQGSIHALVQFRELDTSDPSTYYYFVNKIVTIECYINSPLITYKCDDPTHFTITDNSDISHETNITLTPTSLASDVSILAVWADKWTNMNETLAFPSLTA